jgi:hypothetical protein
MAITRRLLLPGGPGAAAKVKTERARERETERQRETHRERSFMDNQEGTEGR